MAGLICLCVFLFFCGAGLFLLRQWDKKRLRTLREQMEGFVCHPEQAMEIALREDGIAGVQNGICELEEMLLREKRLRTEECRRTEKLTADISHQLKTPLTTLRLYCEMDAAPHARQCLDQITRMETLIGSLLRLERLCADGYPFTFAPHSLERLIREQWEMLLPVFPGRVLTVQGAAEIRCDGQWLGEALHNLLKNACQHTPPGGEIRVTLEKGEAVLFCVIEDGGGGVPEGDLPRLFDRFYRGSRPSGEGSGIGLAMVREILRRHHGTVTAENTGVGLKMTVSLPVYDRNLSLSAP